MDTFFSNRLSHTVVNLEKLPAWQTYRRPHHRFTRYIISIVLFLFVFVLFQKSFFLSSKPTKIQHDFQRNPEILRSQPDRLKAVKNEFLHAYRGYHDHAWMSDSLMSITGSRKDEFCGWSATLIDSLDTLYIMELHDEFEEAVNATIGIDFVASTLNCQVNIFESTIRYLGGLLAAYDLSHDERLLPKLEELGDLLHSAFNSTNGMPCSHCDLGWKKDNSSMIIPPQDAPLADMGSFYLEFARLWQITGNKKYLDTVTFLTSTFERAQNESSIPGLWPERVDASSISGSEPRFVTISTAYSLGALSDSAYEYLIKAHLLVGSLTDQYANMWEYAANSIRQNLLFRAYLPKTDEMDVLFSGIVTREFGGDEILLEPRTQHLGCFAGGMFAMASRIFNTPGDLAIGEALTNGCVWAYDNSPTGIMPETFTLLSCPEMGGPQCEWNDDVWQAARQNPAYCNLGQCSLNQHYPPGYLNSIDTHYALRPEAIESVFIMYRITGNERWRDVGWKMFTKIIEHTRTPFGHASLSTVMEMREQYRYQGNKKVMKMAAIQRDEMESFWLAETLKYFYLLFSDPDLIDLDEFVLNTEAHPLRLVDGVRGFP